jgi:hypothetical protein
VTLTIGVPQPVRGSDWGCAVQITGLTRWLSRTRFVFGIDGIQALELAMQYARVNLETSQYDLTWLDATGDLGLPRFLPTLPKAYRDRIERTIEREVHRFYVEATRKADRVARIRDTNR